MAIASLWRLLSVCGKLYLATMHRNGEGKHEVINFSLWHVLTRCHNKTSHLPKINNYATFFVTLTVSLNYLEFTLAVSMKPPWLGETQGGDTETNVKYGKYSFVILYIDRLIDFFLLIVPSLTRRIYIWEKKWGSQLGTAKYRGPAERGHTVKIPVCNIMGRWSGHSLYT